MDSNDFKGKSPDFTWRRWPGSNEPRLIWNSQPCTRNSFPWIVKTWPQKRVQVNFYNLKNALIFILLHDLLIHFLYFKSGRAGLSTNVNTKTHTHTHTKKRWWEKTMNYSKNLKNQWNHRILLFFISFIYHVFFLLICLFWNTFPSVCVCVCDDCPFRAHFSVIHWRFILTKRKKKLFHLIGQQTAKKEYSGSICSLILFFHGFF